jgi:hypothetical protein
MIKLDKIEAKSPDKTFARQFFGAVKDDLEDHIALMVSSCDDDACRSAWELGYYREAQMATATGLSRKQVALSMERLSEAQEFYHVEEHVHGNHDRLWQKAGVPLGDVYMEPRLSKIG